MSNVLEKARAARVMALKVRASNRLAASKKTAPDGRVYSKSERREQLPVFVSSRGRAPEPKPVEVPRPAVEREQASPVFMSLRTRSESCRYLH